MFSGKLKGWGEGDRGKGEGDWGAVREAIPLERLSFCPTSTDRSSVSVFRTKCVSRDGVHIIYNEIHPPRVLTWWRM